LRAIGASERDPHAVHDVLPHDRPREKLERTGAHALGDNELLAILIGHGSPGCSALGLANAILALSGGVQGLPNVHRAQLLHQPGVGPAQASRVQAAVELGRRTLTPPHVRRPQFLSPRELARYLVPLFGSYPVERFGVLLLDSRHRLLSTHVISVGSVNASPAHPREVFREAVLRNAAVVAAFHNHPSGDPTPSSDDLLLTARLRDAGTVIGVELVDHVILADARYFSMKEQGIL
jgi:DNA repair protein RadC